MGNDRTTPISPASIETGTPDGKRDPRIEAGEALFAAGNLSEARRLFSELQLEHPDDPEILNNLGVIAWEMGAFGEAVRLFEVCLARNPHYPDALENVRALQAVLAAPPLPVDGAAGPDGGHPATAEPILIVMEEGIGNMILLTPAIRALKNCRPNLPVHVLGRYPALEILEGWELVDRILTEPDGTHYDTLFYTLWSSGTREHHGDDLSAHAGTIRTLEYNDPALHESEHYMEIARTLGYKGETPPPYCPVADVAALLPQDRPVVALADTYRHAGWERKSWPHYRTLARELMARGVAVALVGGANEAARFRSEDWPDGVIDLQGKCSLPETAAFLTRCQAVVANDSGPAHMAAALGVPTHVLFGATRRSKNRPLGPHVTAMTAEVPCRPCQYTPSWAACSDWQCMQAISPEPLLASLIPETGALPMKTADVLVVGVLDNPASTNTFMQTGFESLGLNVDAYNYRTRAAALGGYEQLAEDFARFLHGKTYGLILFSKVNGMAPASLRAARSHGKTWYWFMDNIAAARAMGADRYAAACDYASATSQEVTEFFLAANPLTLQVLEGFDPSVLYPETKEKQHDVVFIGNATEKRIELLRAIRSIVPVTLFGKNWPVEFEAHPPVFNENYRQTVAASKIVLNLVHSNIFSDRVVHSLACGAFVLSQYCPDLERHFANGVHLAWFHDTAELATQVPHYLSDDAVREQIARTGQARVKTKYTWERICARVAGTAGVSSNGTSLTPTPPASERPPSDQRKERVLTVSWHGLGDQVMLTPSLRKFKAAHPQAEITLLGLKRFGRTLTELLSGLSFVDQVLPILPDAWNDFDDYPTGVGTVMRDAQAFADGNGFDRVVFLPTQRKPGYRLHKIFRFAEELGVSFDSLEELQTELSVCPEARERAAAFVRDYSKPLLVVHATAGNAPKTLPAKAVAQLIAQYPGYTVFEFGRHSTSRSIRVPEDDMEFSKALIERADMVIAIDSVVMHIAGAFRRPCLAVFTSTPVHQAVPLTYRVDVIGSDTAQTALSRWPGIRSEIQKAYPRQTTGGFDERHYFEGGSSCYQGYWWGERGGMGENIHRRMLTMTGAFPDMFTGARIIDVGCAAGYGVKVLRDCGYEAFGCDPSRWIIEREETLMTPYKQFLKVGSAQSIPFEGPFDTLMALTVLEHLDPEQFQAFLKEVQRLSIKHLLIKVPSVDTPGAKNDPTHILLKSRQWWHDTLDAQGFRFIGEVADLGPAIRFFSKSGKTLPVGSQAYYENTYHRWTASPEWDSFEKALAQVRPYRSRYRAVYRKLRKHLGETGTALFCGVHQGKDAHWFQEVMPRWKINGFDFSRTVLTWLEQHYPGEATFFQADAKAIRRCVDDLKASFDLIVSIDFTEHLPADTCAEFAAETFRVARPGAQLLAMQGTTPLAEHINILSKADFIQLFTQCGWTLADRLPCDHFLFRKPVPPSMGTAHASVCPENNEPSVSAAAPETPPQEEVSDGHPAATALFVTTSNAVCLVEPVSGNILDLLRRGPHQSFFGIAADGETGKIYAAARSDLGTPKRGKYSSDVSLYRIDAGTLKTEKVVDLCNIHDVHQMALFDGRAFLCDTGQNRIAVVNLETGQIVQWIPIGGERRDRHHVNAIHVDRRRILIGLNNRGFRPSAVLEIPTESAFSASGDPDGLEIGVIHEIPGLFHAHDMEPWENDFLICASHDGRVFSFSKRAPLFTAGGWSRGLVVTEEGIWVGASPQADRSMRHSAQLSAALSLFAHGTFRRERTLELPGSGQVHDLVAVTVKHPPSCLPAKRT